MEGRSTENSSVASVQRLAFQMGVFESEKFSFPPVPIVCVRTQPPTQWAPRLFPGSKAAGAWRGPTTSSSAEVKERVELYPYSPYGSSLPVLG
jgi:hypothetical protein